MNEWKMAAVPAVWARASGIGMITLICILGIIATVLVGLTCARRKNYLLWWLSTLVIAIFMTWSLFELLDGYHAVFRPAIEADPTNWRKVQFAAHPIAWLVAIIIAYPRNCRVGLVGAAVCITLWSTTGISIVRREQAYQQAIAPLLEERARIEAVEALGVRIATDGGYANNFRPYPGTKLSMADVVQFSRLTTLDLPGPVKDPENFTVITSLTRLRSIGICHMTFSNAQFASFGDLPDMNDLFLRECDIAGVDLSVLNRCKNLKYVGFVNTTITSAQIGQLCTLKHLDKIDIHKAGASVEEMRLLLGIPGLRDFSIGTQDLSQAEFKMLQRSKPKVHFGQVVDPGWLSDCSP
ncbi:MAG: hypothetical protein JNM18_19610 [Planctomycetaceae bacterium]|nr:hypothetical protein [Planctomycetaceae bacterium]